MGVIMKRFLFFLCALLFCASCYGFSKNDGIAEIQGVIKWYGSTPFQQPGFACDDGRIFSLSVAEEAGFSLEALSELHGTKLRLEGKIEKNKTNSPEILKDGVFEVLTYEKIETKSEK